MIEWKRKGSILEGYEKIGYVASIYIEENAHVPTFVTADNYMFILETLPDLQLAKNVCELALNENKKWEWWLHNQHKWWSDNVSQV
jgi:hypothetical protein